MTLPDRFGRIARKAGPVFAANVLLRVSGTLAFIVVGRLKGPADAGALSLATGYLAIVTTLFLGLDDLLVREVAARPRRTPWLVLSYAALRLPLTLAACAVVLVIMRTAQGLTPSQALAMQLIVASALLDAFGGLGQSVLLALDRPGYLVFPAAVVFVLRVGGGALFLLAAGLAAMAALWPAAALASGVFLVWAAASTLRELQIRAPVRFVRPAAAHFARLAPGFAAVSLLSALEYQVDVILLSAFRGADEVGIYSAAAAIMYLAALAPQAYRSVLFPQFVAKRDQPQALAAAFMRAFGLMAGLGIAMAVVTTLVGPPVLLLIFGSRFALATPVLRVLIWNIVFMCINVPLVRYLLAVGQEKRVWQALLLSTTLNAGANVWIIPAHGAFGSAAVRLASSALFSAIAGWQAYRHLSARQSAVNEVR